MPNNKFHCGRLVIKKNGDVKKLTAQRGGGIRYCEISHIDMGFEEIHDRLREIFLSDETNRNTKLYDFELKELDTNRYTNFYDYIHQRGLQFRITLLYLCTQEDDDDRINPPSSKKQRTTQTISNPAPIIRNISQVEPDSSTSSIIIKTGHNPRSINECAVNNYTTENLQRSSFSNSSFDQNLNISRDQSVNKHSKSYSSTNDAVSSFSSSSSSRYDSEIDSQKRRYSSSRSPNRSSSSNNKSTKDDNDEIYPLFQNLLKSFHHFLDALHKRCFTEFYGFVGILIREIIICRSNIKLTNYQSLYDAEKLIISIENRLEKRINGEYKHRSSPGITQQVKYSFNETLISIENFLNTLRHYKLQIDIQNRSLSSKF